MLRLHATLGALFLLVSTALAADAPAQTNKQSAAEVPPPILLFEGQNVTAKEPPQQKSLAAKPADGPVATIFATATSPIRKMFSWGSSLLSKKEAAVEAVEMSEPDHRTPLKIRSIQYLAEMDDQSYPRVVDSLLASLDDTAEEVRFEALRAVTEKCKNYQCEFVGEATFVRAQDCDCAGCRADRKVLHRLNALLLDRGPNGLREQSQRNRDLAIQTIMTCLSRKDRLRLTPDSSNLVKSPTEE